MTEKASVFKITPYEPEKGTHHSVFRHFRNGLEEITFSPVEGTAIAGERTIMAIVKAKMGLKRASQLRRTSSDLTIHCFPEDFADVVNPQDVIGAAIRWRGRQYSLDGVTLGKNYETGVVEHITFNCSLAIYSDDRPKFALEKDRSIFITTETGRLFMVEQFGEYEGAESETDTETPETVALTGATPLVAIPIAKAGVEIPTDTELEEMRAERKLIEAEEAKIRQEQLEMERQTAKQSEVATELELMDAPSEHAPTAIMPEVISPSSLDKVRTASKEKVAARLAQVKRYREDGTEIARKSKGVSK